MDGLAEASNAVNHDADEGIPRYVSHVSDDGRYESVSQHLNEVAEMAEGFARPFGAGEWARWAGLYHDIGKYSDAFQRRILRHGPRCDHSTAGAQKLDEVNTLLAYAVAGHHGGLPNGGSSSDPASEPTLMGRLKRKPGADIPDYAAFENEVSQALPETLSACPITPVRLTEPDCEYTIGFLTRMVYSCLVDADFLCTERFMRGEARPRSGVASLRELRDMLEQRLKKFYPPKGALNELRCDVLDDCLKASRLPKGFFSLTVPTGGGKTYASLRFALSHAVEREMDRVVYGIPYTSIIEQNAQVFRDVFGDENVLEHHGGVEFDEAVERGGDQDDVRYRLRLASENWDARLIVTTNVQLFESLYASKPSRCRKLHNLANSVIVLDEAQMLPTKQLLPCLRALVELVHGYGCSVVFCTATQPALDSFVAEYGYDVTEIATDVPRLFEELRRVTYEDVGRISDEVLALRLIAENQVLCVVNSRAQARRLYELLLEHGNGESCFHLSTLMHAEHRSRVIGRIRERLRLGEACRVVSTSLIEAGVDLDFPTVYRAKAGLDSLIQAAGRCNRNNRRPAAKSHVYLFDPADEYHVPADTEHKRSVMRDYAANPEAIDLPENVAAYFKRLFSYADLDGSAVQRDLSDAKFGYDGIPFKCAAERFMMIEDGSYPIVIPDSTTRDLIDGLRRGIVGMGVMRRLARHSVSVYEGHLKGLLASGMIEPLVAGERVFALVDEGAYDEATGLTPAPQEGRAVFF